MLVVADNLHNFYTFHALRDFIHFFIVLNLHNFFVFFVSWYGRQNFRVFVFVKYFQVTHLGNSENQVLAIAGLNVDGALSVQLKQGLDSAAMNALAGRLNHNSATNELDWGWGGLD